MFYYLTIHMCNDCLYRLFQRISYDVISTRPLLNETSFQRSCKRTSFQTKSCTGTVSSAVRVVEALLVDGFDRDFCGALPEPALSVVAASLSSCACAPGMYARALRSAPATPARNARARAEHVQHHCASKADFYVQTAAMHTLIIVIFGDVFLNSPITLL